jgi:hypothetical protein
MYEVCSNEDHILHQKYQAPELRKHGAAYELLSQFKTISCEVETDFFC